MCSEATADLLCNAVFSAVVIEAEILNWSLLILFSTPITKKNINIIPFACKTILFRIVYERRHRRYFYKKDVLNDLFLSTFLYISYN